MFYSNFVNFPEKFSVNPEKIQNILEYIGIFVEIPQHGTLNFAFLPDEEIHVLNKNYREKDSSTDVLSFHYFDDFSHIEDNSEVVGECIFSENKILEQSEKFGHSPEQEFEILAIHSVLHILGFDHETDDDYAEMWEYELPIRSYFQLEKL